MHKRRLIVIASVVVAIVGAAAIWAWFERHPYPLREAESVLESVENESGLESAFVSSRSFLPVASFRVYNVTIDEEDLVIPKGFEKLGDDPDFKTWTRPIEDGRCGLGLTWPEPGFSEISVGCDF